MTPAWGNGLKDFAPSIGSAEDLKQYIVPTDFRMQLAVFENRNDAVETLEYLKTQDVPYKKRKLKRHGYKEVHSLPISEAASSRYSIALASESDVVVTYKTFLELKSDVRNNSACIDARSSHSW